MKNLDISRLFGSMFGIRNQSAARKDCVTYLGRECRDISESDFSYHAKSKSATFTKGMSSRLKITFYSGMDYSITMCAETILGHQIGLVLTNSRMGELWYDNATDNYARHTIFSCKKTCEAFITVTVPGPAPTKVEPEEIGCLAILIEHRVTNRERG